MFATIWLVKAGSSVKYNKKEKIKEAAVAKTTAVGFLIILSGRNAVNVF